MLKRHITFFILSSSAALFSPLCLKHSVLAAFSLRPAPLNAQTALIGQFPHAWAITANKKTKAACAKLICTFQTSR